MKTIKTRLVGILGCLLALSLILSVGMPVLAIPQIPHQFWGQVTIGGVQAEEGTPISAEIGGVVVSTTVDAQGRYGYQPFLFRVPADDPETSQVEGGTNGESIEFSMDGAFATTHDFQIAGRDELDLSVGEPPPTLTAEAGGPYSGTTGASITLSGSASDGTLPYTYAWDLDNDEEYDDAVVANPSHSWATAGSYTVGLQVTDASDDTATDTATVTVTPPYTPPAPEIETDLFGTEASFETNSDGEIQETIEATSEDGMLSITIPEGTVALDENGDPLETLEAAVDESPPDSPDHIIGAYDFGPDGATFDPAITLTWSYDPDALPEGVAEEDLVIAYYDEAASEWVELDCVVDTQNNIVTASISHFTTFALIGAETEPEPLTPADIAVTSITISPEGVEVGESVTITVNVTNSGEETGSELITLKVDGVEVDSQYATLAGGVLLALTFTISEDVAGTYTVSVNGQTGTFTVEEPEPEPLTLESIAVTPESASILVGETQAFTATGTYSDESTADITAEAVWTSSDTAVATVGICPAAGAVATAVSVGTTTITATLDEISGLATLTVTAEEEGAGINWPVVGGIIGGLVVVLCLLVYFFVLRRRD